MAKERWLFEKDEAGWYWTCLDEASHSESSDRFSTFEACVADAELHGYADEVPGCHSVPGDDKI